MVACTLMAGMEIVVGPAGLAGEGGLVESADRHQQLPDSQQRPEGEQGEDRTPGGRTVLALDAQSWCLSGDLDQLISLSILTALR